MSNAMQRTSIQHTDTVLDVILKLSQGNPGAASVLADVLTSAAHIDPAIGHPIMYVLFLDELGIRGAGIWVLFKNACEGKIDRFLALLRAYQLGILRKDTLQSLATDSPSHDWDKIRELIRPHYAKVKQQVPVFQWQECDSSGGGHEP